jgi:hypothetical protein
MLLLRAFGLECLLKALWLYSGRKLVDGRNYIGPRGAKGHNLLALADAVGVILAAQERALLSHLAQWVEGGRYPVEAKRRDDALYLWSDAHERDFRRTLKTLSARLPGGKSTP